MRKTKPIFALLIALILCLMTACGSSASSGGDSDQGKTEPEAAAEAEEPAAEAEEPAAEAEESAPSASSGKVYEVKISHVVPETDVIHKAYLELEEALEASGRFDVTIYPNRQLSNSNAEDMEKVMANIVQIAAAPTSVLAGSANVPEMQIFDYPFMFSDNEQLYYCMDNGLTEYLSEKVSAGSKMIIKGAVNGGWCPISDDIPYKTPEDMKGRLIRILNSEMYMKMLASWGAVGTPIAWGETFTALQQGTCDGLLTSFPAWYSDRFSEVQDCLNLINPVPIIHMTCVNSDFYNSLDDEAKQIFDDGMKIYDNAMREYRAKESEDCYKMYKDGLMKQVVEYTDEELQPFIDATAAMREDTSAVGDECMDLTKKLLEEYEASK